MNVSLDELRGWERNYRRGDLDAIERSFEAFGFNGALRVRHGVVFAGNQALATLRRMRERGKAAPRGVEVDASGRWLVPTIDIGHLSEAEATAFAIADNRTQELGETNTVALLALLDDLADDAALEAATGYDSEDIQALIGELSQVEVRRSGDGAAAVPAAICPECGQRLKG